MKILVYGSLNIDLLFSVDCIVLPGETIRSEKLVRSAGGKGANQAAALAKAGLNVYLAGKIGEDGKFLLPLLNSYGVDTGYVREYKGQTGQAIIQIDKNGQNSIILYAGGNALITGEEIKDTFSLFNKGDIIVLQNEINGLAEIMETAIRKEMKIYFNPSPYDASVETLPLSGVNVFFVNEIEAAAMAKTSAETPPEKIIDILAERFPSAEIILTAGENGAYYGHGNIRERAEIVKTKVVDTVGAGDTFSGYFIAACNRSFPAAEALRIACKASSIAVSRHGAMEAVPLAEEIF